MMRFVWVAAPTVMIMRSASQACFVAQEGAPISERRVNHAQVTSTALILVRAIKDYARGTAQYRLTRNQSRLNSVKVGTFTTLNKEASVYQPLR